MIQSRENKMQNTYILLSLHTLYFHFSYFLTSTIYEIDYWFLIISYGYIKIIMTSKWADIDFKRLIVTIFYWINETNKWAINIYIGILAKLT